MKKNKVMRFASVVLVMTLLSTCMVGGAFAKYTTQVSDDDSARVAYWGFQSSNSMNLTGLFTDTYTNVQSVIPNGATDGDDVIAPGTSGSTTFAFAWDEVVSDGTAAVAVTGPEVAYSFVVDVEGNCDDLIKNNKNILWAVYPTPAQGSEPATDEWGDWAKMIKELEEMDGDETYAPGELPENFTSADESYTIAWKWIFADANATANSGNTYTVDNNTLNQDEYDTYMGNAEVLDDCSITITITATQID